MKSSPNSRSSADQRWREVGGGTIRPRCRRYLRICWGKPAAYASSILAQLISTADTCNRRKFPSRNALSRREAVIARRFTGETPVVALRGCESAFACYARGLDQEPSPVLRLVGPHLQQARSGDIPVRLARFVKDPQATGYCPVVFE